jgi:hypothetical protein
MDISFNLCDTATFEFLINPSQYDKLMKKNELTMDHVFRKERRFYKRRILALTRDLFNKKVTDLALVGVFNQYLKDCIQYLKFNDIAEIIQRDYNGCSSIPSKDISGNNAMAMDDYDDDNIGNTEYEYMVNGIIDTDMDTSGNSIGSTMSGASTCSNKSSKKNNAVRQKMRDKREQEKDNADISDDEGTDDDSSNFNIVKATTVCFKPKEVKTITLDNFVIVTTPPNSEKPMIVPQVKDINIMTPSFKKKGIEQGIKVGPRNKKQKEKQVATIDSQEPPQ